LLDNAAAKGVDVEQGNDVTAFEIHPERGVEVSARSNNGHVRTFKARVLADATGQRSLIAGRLKLRRMDPELKNFALYSHFEGAARASGDREGDISIVVVPEGWWWVIPLKNDKTSLGLVAPAAHLAGQRPDEAYLLEKIAQTPYLAQRFAGATRIAPVRTISDYSYVSERMAGDRWIAVGDAAAFLDPVFSTGVYLGMLSAFRAADLLHTAIARDAFERKQFAEYERWLQNIVAKYRSFVRGFYRPEFVEIMMNPSDKFGLRQAVTSLLAGGADSFAVTWRIWLFRAITRLNRDLMLTPRLPGRREAAQRVSASM
jgi:flavin-dependent dehydrogenase